MFKPLYNYILLERLEDADTTAGGIIIPDNAREKPARGRVVAAGNGIWIDGMLVPPSVRPGDTVMFAKWAASAADIKLDGKDFIIIKETDILGII
ncbi:MAG: co-chaperone GroES [Alphaproteobacteria bacterium]|nr:co-chaperone GroES [Alphaproteobacteria bacterium]